MSDFHSVWLDFDPATPNRQTDKTDKTDAIEGSVSFGSLAVTDEEEITTGIVSSVSSSVGGTENINSSSGSSGTSPLKGPFRTTPSSGGGEKSGTTNRQTDRTDNTHRMCIWCHEPLPADRITLHVDCGVALAESRWGHALSTKGCR